MADAEAGAPQTSGAYRNLRLAEQLIGLTTALSRLAGQSQLATATAAIGEHVRLSLSRNCQECMTEVSGRAIEPLLLPAVPRKRQDRRDDFLFRVLVAQFSDRIGSPAADSGSLPRAVLGNLAGFFERELGTFLYADLNTGACRMISLLGDESDGSLRDAAFTRPDTRAIAFKVLLQVVAAVCDWHETYRLFTRHVVQENHRGVTFRASLEHFQLIYGRLFARLLECLQDPQQLREAERQVGHAAAARILKLYEAYARLSEDVIAKSGTVPLGGGPRRPGALARIGDR